jgi:predicted amidohydrolase
MAEVEGGDFCLRMSKLARELNIVLFAGTVGERSESQNEKKVFNTSFVFDRKGDLIARYRKIHLFNLSDATGKPLYCESDGFLSGQDIVTLDIDGFHVGLSICYDLRFASLYESMAKKRPLDVIMVPSAFTLGTGMYHWELLLRARAVEQLAYVVAPNQVGTHSPGKMSYGHAMIVDPWGTKICDTGSKPGIALANLSKDTIAGYRAQLPALANRRFDLY